MIRLAILVSYGDAGVEVCRDCADCSGLLYVEIGDSGLIEEAEFFGLSGGCSDELLTLAEELEVDLVVGSMSPTLAEALVEQDIAVMNSTFSDPMELVKAYVSGELSNPLSEAGLWLTRPNN